MSERHRHPLLKQLALLRLQQDLSFGELAVRTGVKASTLVMAIQRGSANERTLFKIRQYLEHTRSEAR